MSFAQKLLVMGSVAMGLGVTAIHNAMAYTVDAITGFPVVEASDTTAMVNGIGASGVWFLNFMTANWKVIAAIIVLGAIVAFVISIPRHAKAAVTGR